MTQVSTNPLKTLHELDAFFDSPSKWTQNAPAKDINGSIVRIGDPSAVCWCMTGALSVMRTRPFITTMITQATKALWPKNKKEGMSIIDFNDSRSGFEAFKSGLKQMIAYWEQLEEERGYK